MHWFVDCDWIQSARLLCSAFQHPNVSLRSRLSGCRRFTILGTRLRRQYLTTQVAPARTSHHAASFDDAPIQAHPLVLEPELLSSALAAHQFLAWRQSLLEHCLVKLPRADAHWHRPKGTSWAPPALPIASPALRTLQTAANLAPRTRPSHLAKQHRHELAPTGETPARAVRPCAA
jgi:hypothetical protein